MSDSHRAAAQTFGLVLAGLQLFRTVCTGWIWPTPGAWPIALDAYVQCAIFFWAARSLGDRRAELARLAMAYGVSFGILYRSFFEQLGNPARWAGFDALTLVVKGALLLAAAGGAVASVRARGQEGFAPTTDARG